MSKDSIKVINVSALISSIQAAETKAHRLGMHVTAHTLNRAVNALGWEMQGNIVAAGEAAHGDDR